MLLCSASYWLGLLLRDTNPEEDKQVHAMQGPID